MSRADDAMIKLRMLINSDKIPITSRLPPERLLAVELGVSRAALRGALGRLEAEGQVWRHVGKGTFVGSRPKTRPEDLAVVSHMTSPAEIMELRLLIEPPIAGLAALRATAADIAHMHRCLSKLEQSVDRGSESDSKLYDQWDGTLHRSIAEASHNALVLALFDSFNAVRKLTVWGQLQRAGLAKGRWQLYCCQHRSIIDAIADRDLMGAERQMRIHLETVRRYQLEKLHKLD